jgi:hypothetical protein
LTDIVLRYSGRSITAADIAQIRVLCAAHPELSRLALSRELCALWHWRQPNRVLRDMVCRSMLLV